MPRLSVWAIRLSLVYLALGFTFGGLILANKGIPFDPALWSLLPAHIEFLLFGWTSQLVLGVAFWILPRFSSGSRRGNEHLAWLALVLLNLGVWLAVIGSVPGLDGVLPLLARMAQAGAALAFALHAWPRVKPPGA
jgi:hypothetical protein